MKIHELFIFLTFFSRTINLERESDMEENLKRPSSIAGLWYPSKPLALKKTINSYLDAVAPTVILSEIVSIVVPHAGYVYSGQTAAYAYAPLKGKKFDFVVVCSPLHAYHPAKVLTTDHNAFQIPFDAIPVAKDELEQINQAYQIKTGDEIVPIAFDQEHSLEIQLPFIYTVLQCGFKLIPLMVRTDDFETVSALAEAVFETMQGKSVLFVASTDLSHFYQQKRAIEFDTVMVQSIVDLDAKQVMKNVNDELAFACGASAVATVIEISKKIGVSRAQLLNYCTSGDITGEYNNVVGYAALALLR